MIWAASFAGQFAIAIPTPMAVEMSILRLAERVGFVS